ncbi:MAG: 16S rRNA (cytidine(1402)-2'-O)-methyltransferase [Rhodocyclaceae bacterium]|nr:16S rRNA (cytidine(1402)-2'-O)-methyltransferase [Rhodocyclaceae bacterium]
MSSHSSLSVMPTLYVVATPLGNLDDISRRAVNVLGQVAVVAAEDTRHSQRLLDAIGVRARLIALHEHNEQSAATQVLHMLEQGQSVALISDAGTPGISDPGARAVRRVREAGFAVVPVPGACAAIAALSVSGFDAAGFRFVGFLPPKAEARRRAIQGLRGEQAAVVLYESPHRIAECLADLAAELEPGREILIAREMTKLHEQTVCLPVGEAPAWLAGDANRSRGEFVLVLSAAPPLEEGQPDAAAEQVLRTLLDELPASAAARVAATLTGLPRKQLYARALELKQD